MIDARSRPFEDIEVREDSAIIFLDVDGTLTSDGSHVLVDEVKDKIGELKKKHEVYLCTNMKDVIRKKELENVLQLPSTNVNYKKPDKRIAETFITEKRKRIVIGDKWLVDGRFAKNIGAEFIKVKRKVAGNEPFSVKCVYVVDDVLSYLFCLI